MNRIVLISLIGLFLTACGEEKEFSSINPINWDKRKLTYKLPDTLSTGKTYLSVYSEIYSLSEHRTHDLTATISLRNIDPEDSIFIFKATYYDTHGEKIRSYFEKPIFLAPFETVEIIIDEKDNSGGSGGNFYFEWKTKIGSPEPLFESVMISTSGQQGVSFSTIGRRID